MIGRFLSTDPLAELAPDWTPYRYGFNNPISFIDPDGLFEDEAAARAHAKKNDIKLRPKSFLGKLFTSGSRSNIVENKDGTFSIEHADGSMVMDMGGEIGIQAGVAISPTDRMETSFESGGLLGEAKLVESLRDGSEREVPLAAGTAPSPGKSVKAASSLAKGVRTLSKRIKEHINKLINYRGNSNASDNLGKLKDVAPDIQRKIINGRTKKLQREIRKLVNEREKLKGGK